MLTLMNANYSPPSGYAILADPNFPLANAASELYRVIVSLTASGWFGGLGQYGIGKLEWRGMLDSFLDVDTPNTIIMMLPRGPGSVPGFMTQWGAYHNYQAPTVFSWLPASLTPYGNAVMSLNQWMVGATHELMEALTDAEPGQGWVNTAANNEGADVCSAILPFVGTTVSSYWLNDRNRCFTAEDF